MTLETILDGISTITKGLNKSASRPTTAGRLTEAEADNQPADPGKQLLLDKSMTDFMWVNSNSMSGAGIHPGDMVIIDRSVKAVSGKIVLALLNGEMLIRRFEKILNKVRLVPESDALAPIDVDGNYEGFMVCGVVTHVIRPLA